MEGKKNLVNLSSEADSATRWQLLLRVKRTGLGFNDARCAAEVGDVSEPTVEEITQPYSCIPL